MISRSDLNSISNGCLWESVWASRCLCLCCLSDSRRACLHCSSCLALLSCCLLNLRLAFLVCLLACSPFSSLCALSHISERVPTILFCFNRIHGRVFFCSEIWRRVATELVKKYETGLLPRACTLLPMCSWGSAYIHMNPQHYVSALWCRDKRDVLKLAFRDIQNKLWEVKNTSMKTSRINSHCKTRNTNLIL